jgi:hypothetical protein
MGTKIILNFYVDSEGVCAAAAASAEALAGGKVSDGLPTPLDFESDGAGDDPALDVLPEPSDAYAGGEAVEGEPAPTDSPSHTEDGVTESGELPVPSDGGQGDGVETSAADDGGGDQPEPLEPPDPQELGDDSSGSDPAPQAGAAEKTSGRRKYKE